MSHPQLLATNGRQFACFAAAVMVFIIEPATRRFLMLSSPPKRARPGWEIVQGAVEANETLRAAVTREVAEEVGPDVAIEVLGTVDAWTWRFDNLVPNMISVAFLASYLGGDIRPGDDMLGCEARWLSLDEIRALDANDVALIPGSTATFDRALHCFDWWSG